jgi:hypothetical protein
MPWAEAAMEAEGDRIGQQSDRVTVHQCIILVEVIVAAIWVVFFVPMIFIWIIVAIAGIFLVDYQYVQLHEVISGFVAPFGGLFAIGYAFRSLMNALHNEYPVPRWSQLIALLGAVLAIFEFSKWGDLKTAILVSSPMWIVAMHLIYLALSRHRRTRPDSG